MQRGRKSLESLLVKDAAVAVANERPQPPDRLSKDEAILWDAICASMDANWFSPETQPVLETLCAQIIVGRDLNQEVRDFPRDLLKTQDGALAFKALLQMQTNVAKTIASLSTKLRLTPQSRYNALRANTLTRNAQETSLKSPWDIRRKRRDD